MSKHPAAPDIHFVPLGKITIFAVTESELLEIKKGSSDSVFFAWGLSCLFLFVPTLLSMLVLETKNQKISTAYLVVTIVSGLASSVLFWLWKHHKTNTYTIVEAIIARKPPHGIQSPDSTLPPAITAEPDQV